MTSGVGDCTVSGGSQAARFAAGSPYRLWVARTFARYGSSSGLAYPDETIHALTSSQAVERDIDGTDLLAGPAPGALPLVAGELFARLHVAAEQQVEGSPHLVLPQGEDAPARRGALPAGLLVGRAHGDAVPAHRTRVDILLNGRHLREPRHSTHLPDHVRSSAS